MPRRASKQPRHPQARVTGWAPKTEQLHRLARQKLGSSRDTFSVSQRELEEPAQGFGVTGVGA